MTDLASLRIAEDRIEWGVEETTESGKVNYWPTDHKSLHEAESDLAWWRRRYPRRTLRVVSHRVIVTQWADADE